MALNYDGSATTLRASGASVNPSSGQSWWHAAWVKAAGAGENSQGFLFQTSPGAGTAQSTRINSASRDLAALENTSGTDAESVTTGVIPTGAWRLVVTQYDNATRQTRIFVGTESALPTEGSYASQPTGTGTYTANVDEATVGNDISGVRTWNGDLSWNCLVRGVAAPTATELLNLWCGVVPASLTGYVWFLKMASTTIVDEVGTLTWTRTAGGSTGVTADPIFARSGTSSWTEGADTSTGTGTVSSGGITGTSSWTEGADTAAGAGTFTTTGSSSWTDQPDTCAAAGTFTTKGTAAWTEGADTAAGAGTFTTTGSSSWTDQPDTAAGAGTFTTTGSSSWTEGADTCAGTGTVGAAVIGTSSWTEQPDTCAGVGTSTSPGPVLVDVLSEQRADAARRTRARATISTRAGIARRTRGHAR